MTAEQIRSTKCTCGTVLEAPTQAELEQVVEEHNLTIHPERTGQYGVDTLLARAQDL